MKIAFLGGGKIGRAMIGHVLARQDVEIAFVYDPFLKAGDLGSVKVAAKLEKGMFEGLDLVVECANAEVVTDNLEDVLSCCSFMPFSMTAFRDDGLRAKSEELSKKYGTNVFLPHGAILGLDGIFDGREALTEVTVETIKNPKSLGRDDTELTVLYEGPTRKATELYPKNVNVHAAIALAGIGFDRTWSKITADPAVNTNTHVIHLAGQGIDFTIRVSSFSEGGVSGKYVPLSACGSLDRVLGGAGFRFV
ncbi:aspartate dehydrogenase domain-containing protein [uncultured Clostridium sp.]|uniref:aspartate dehydrogenase domain-containing protein n=1 Tax=uncultured Clostridium sp. TaxID=59620 RepID=UPI0025E97B7D|nr:aspartate dehydrogenase domain-containing protein [uncultured Clostridium sp.]